MKITVDYKDGTERTFPYLVEYENNILLVNQDRYVVLHSAAASINVGNTIFKLSYEKARDLPLFEGKVTLQN